jgi:hypothetical protein
MLHRSGLSVTAYPCFPRILSALATEIGLATPEAQAFFDVFLDFGFEPQPVSAKAITRLTTASITVKIFFSISITENVPLL